MPVRRGKAILDDSGKAILDDSGKALLDDSSYVVSGRFFYPLTASFSGGAKIFKMRLSDNARLMVITLGGNDYEEPASAVLKIKTDSQTISKTLSRDVGAPIGEWYCEWSQEEISALSAGSHRCEVFSTQPDNTNATFPSDGKLTVKVQAIL